MIGNAGAGSESRAGRNQTPPMIGFKDLHGGNELGIVRQKTRPDAVQNDDGKGRTKVQNIRSHLEIAFAARRPGEAARLKGPRPHLHGGDDRHRADIQGRTRRWYSAVQCVTNDRVAGARSGVLERDDQIKCFAKCRAVAGKI